MDSDYQDIEDTLKGIRPVALGPACMERLLAAAEGRLQARDLALAGVEQRLGEMTPLAVSPLLADGMLATVSRMPFPVTEKVLLFPGSAKPVPKNRSRSPWYAAAAAVAVAGAFSALLVQQPAPDAGRRVAKHGPRNPAGPPTGFVPASVGSGLEEAVDQGVMWTPEGKPVRMVRVIYMDRAKYRNEQGEIIEMERPRIEYLMVPEKID